MVVMDFIFPYAETTHNVTVRVAPRYLPDQSDSRAPRHVWSYHVRVENHGLAPVQLVARHWRITDGEGRTEAIDGPGVIGQQPHIDPGGAFDYVSGCPLATPAGRMEGHYDMVGEAGAFAARIPAFRLERTPADD